MKKLFCVFLLASVVMGCSSTEGGRVFTTQDNIHKEEIASINNIEEKKFTYDVSGVELSDFKQKLLNNLHASLSEKFRTKSIPTREKHDDFSLFLKPEDTSQSSVKLFSQMQWSVDESGLLISFETIQKYMQREALAYQRFKIPFDFRYDETTKLLTWSISTPNEYLHRNSNLGAMPMVIPPYPENELLSEMQTIFNQVDVETITFDKEKKIEGSFTVNYRDDSVYANFIQLGVNTTVERDIKKTAKIILKEGDVQYVTFVAVYPWRDVKSKVTYTSYLKSILWINNDGTTKLDKFPTKSKIENMLKGIANG